MLKKFKILTACLLFITTAAKAEDIIVGPGKGIIWSGHPFNLTQSAQQGRGQHWYAFGVGYLSLMNTCMDPKQMTSLPEGFSGYKITTGVYLLPRATINGHLYVDPLLASNAKQRKFSGTLGYPTSRVNYTDTGEVIPLKGAWCAQTPWIWAKGEKGQLKTTTITGDWIIYTDGTQVPSNTIYTSPTIKGVISSNASASGGATMDEGGDLVQIIISGVNLRVVGVECSVTTQTNINFGDVAYDTTPDAELGSAISPFAVNCKQGAQRTAVNINASFKANTGIFNANNTQLALTQGGGYITGEIGNGITGSGACAAHPTAVNFAQVPVKLTTMLATDPSADFNSTITWRLCSGGAALPVGNINASAELSIVFS